MASINARIARALAVRPAAGRGHPSGRMTGRAVGRGQDTNRRRKYSYCHGYDNHNGSVRKVMLSDRECCVTYETGGWVCQSFVTWRRFRRIQVE